MGQGPVLNQRTGSKQKAKVERAWEYSRILGIVTQLKKQSWLSRYASYENRLYVVNLFLP